MSSGAIPEARFKNQISGGSLALPMSANCIKTISNKAPTTFFRNELYPLRISCKASSSLDYICLVPGMNLLTVSPSVVDFINLPIPNPSGAVSKRSVTFIKSRTPPTKTSYIFIARDVSYCFISFLRSRIVS